jgi:hypothetical protein
LSTPFYCHCLRTYDIELQGSTSMHSKTVDYCHATLPMIRIPLFPFSRCLSSGFRGLAGSKRWPVTLLSLRRLRLPNGQRATDKLRMRSIPMKHGKDCIIFPLDVSPRDEAIKYVTLFKDTVGLFKAVRSEASVHKQNQEVQQPGRNRGFTLESRQIIGQPAGPGIATGKARVVLHSSDLFTFQRNEILVCDAVDPGMSFVVPLASAIVERRGACSSMAPSSRGNTAFPVSQESLTRSIR